MSGVDARRFSGLSAVTSVSARPLSQDKLTRMLRGTTLTGGVPRREALGATTYAMRCSLSTLAVIFDVCEESFHDIGNW